MAAFKEFLVENAQQGFDLVGKLKTVDELLNAKRLDRMLPYIVAFQDGVAADAIYNPVVTEAKDAVKQLLGDAYHAIWSASAWMGYKHPVHQLLREHDIDVDAYIDAGSAKKAIRSLTAAENVVTDAVALADFAKMKRLAEAFVYCIDAFKAVQNRIIKGHKPAEQDPNTFHSKMGTAHSVATVRTHLLKSITPPLDDFEAQVKAWFETVLKRLAALAANGEVKASSLHGMDAFIFQQTYDYKARGWDKAREYYDVKLRASAHDFPAREAASQRKTIEETFLHKNALKLSALLDKKGNLTSIDVLPGVPVKLHNGAGTLTSTMQVKFADSSEFTVRNKVIINTSSAGRSFYQYPTTFHDVKLPDGSKLEAPSEEKMVKVFGG